MREIQASEAKVTACWAFGDERSGLRELIGFRYMMRVISD
jgi:hypothetical protein